MKVEGITMKKNLKKILTIMLAVILIMQASLASVSAYGWGASAKKGGKGGYSWTKPSKPDKNKEETPVVEEAEPAVTETPVEELQEEAPVEVEAPVEESEAALPEENTEEAAPVEVETPAGEPEEAPAAEAEVIYPALSETKDVQRTDISVAVDAPKGAFPEGTALDVSKVSEAKVENAAASVTEGEVKEIAAVDISFKNDGEEIEPAEGTEVEVVIYAPALKDGALPKLIHIKDDGTVEEILDAQFDQVNGTVKFISGEFSTYALVWTEGGNEYSATIHWGTYENGEFTELESPTTIDSTAASAKLDVIIDAEKYYFVGAEYKADETAEGRNLTNTTIKKVDGVWQATVEGATEGSTETIQIANGSHIYVNYAEYGEGGYTPPPKPGAGVLPPTTEKQVSQNPDGTYTIQLDITGQQDEVIQQVGANVIVIMDITQSMTNRMPGSTSTRMAAAKSALTTLIDTLKPGTNLINFTAVNFGNSANYSNGVNWTTTETAMRNYISGLPNNPSDLGTCWQAGLQGGIDRIGTAPAGNETYVIFVTDGNPNGWVENGRYRQQGSGQFVQAAYNAAVPNANTVGSRSHFYGVFVGDADGYTHLNNLVTNAHGVKTINGTSEDDLKTEFGNIAQTIIDNLGAGSVVVDDGVPCLSDISANVTGGEAGGFEYYVTPKNGTQRVWDEAPGASYSNSNGVTWNLSEAGVLQDGWVYTLKFTVWPSQDAYDLIADLNNGLVDWDELSDAEKAGIEGSKEAGYTLKTNTHLNTTFKDLDGTVYQDIPEHVASAAMRLPTNTITVEKYWHNEMDTREATNVTLMVTKDGKNYKEVQMGEPVETIPGKEWEQTPTEEIYISVGLMSCDADGNLEIHSPGHDYTVVEPPAFSYRWDLSADIYHPMIINADVNATVLIEVEDEDIPASLANLDNNKRATAGGETYYKFDNKLYVAQPGDNVLVANNDRRSSLYIDKKVTGTDAPADAVFPIQITLDNPNSPHPGEEGYDAWYHTMWFAVQTDPRDSKTVVKEGVTVEDATAEAGNTGFYWFDNGGTATVYLKADQYLVVTNLAKGTTFTVEELDGDDMPDGFTFTEATSTAVNKQDEEVTPAAIDGAVAEGTIERPNSEYTVTYNNKYEGFFYVYHSSDNSVERFPAAVKGKKVTGFNIFEKTATGTFYGGYYDGYAGASTGFNAKALTYTNNKSKDEGEDAKAYTYAYIKEIDRAAWDDATPYTVSGKAMNPTADTVYYLKEVPTAYLLPYTHYTYNKSDKLLRNMWYLSAIDDLNYDQAGFFVETFDANGKKESTIVDTLTVTNATGGATVTLSPKSVFGNKGGAGNGVQAGYLGYWDAKALIKANTTSKFTPFWFTPDSIYVCGTQTRTISFNNGKVGTGGMRVADAANATPFPILE